MVFFKKCFTNILGVKLSLPQVCFIFMYHYPSLLHVFLGFKGTINILLLMFVGVGLTLTVDTIRLVHPLLLVQINTRKNIVNFPPMLPKFVKKEHGWRGKIWVNLNCLDHYDSQNKLFMIFWCELINYFDTYMTLFTLI